MSFSEVLHLKNGLKHSPAWILCRGIVILLIAGLAGATLVRLTPGFGIDERELDPRLSTQSLQIIHRENSAEVNPLVFYKRFLVGVLRGDYGRSVVFAQPVGQLIRERAPRTLRTVAAGLAYGWISALLLATLAALTHREGTFLAAMALSGSLLSIPSAVLAAISLLLQLPVEITLAAVIFPRIFPNAYELLRASLLASHVVMARAKGLRATRVFLFHAFPSAMMPLVALGAVSVTIAFGASIPIEALADSPGVGQLAWKAALGRDLPVLVNITLLLTAITVAVNVTADLMLMRFRQHTA